jgi:hypothetical protein
LGEIGEKGGKGIVEKDWKRGLEKRTGKRDWRKEQE